MLFIDRMILDDKPRRTADGYLVAAPKIARTGIQEYLASEVGLRDRAPDSIVRVYRPEEEVFSDRALKSMAHRPVTVDHPPVLVDAKNWKEYAKGMTGGDVVRDGEFVRVPMVLMDDEAIKEVEDGKAELSAGYTADLEFTPGKTPSGESYDAIQRNIRGNHLAIVDAARGGSQLRVIDTNSMLRQGDMFMSLKKVIIDGITVETTETAAEVYDKTIKAKDEQSKKDKDRIKELEDELEELRGKGKKESETKDAEIATLKKQLDDAKMTPAKLDDAVKQRASVIDAARKVLPTVTVDGKSDAEIRRQVVDSRLGETAKGWSDEQVSASFNTLTTGTTDAYRQAHQNHNSNNSNVAAYDQYKKNLSDAWKPKTA